MKSVKTCSVSSTDSFRAGIGVNQPKSNKSDLVWIFFILAVISASLWPKFSVDDILLISNQYGLIQDDCFYYMEIARNFHVGHYFSFDKLTTTNGFYYLWALFLAILYGILDFLSLEHHYFKSVLSLNAIIFMSCGILFFRLLSPIIGKCSSAMIITSGMLLYSSHFMNGMETSVTLLASLITTTYLRNACSLGMFKVRSLLLAGACFMIFLARLDAIVICIVLFVCMLWRFPGLQMLKSLAVFLAMTGIYVLSNLYFHDSAFPVSGSVKVFWSEVVARTPAEMWQNALYSISQFFFGSIYFVYRPDPVLSGYLILFVITLLFFILGSLLLPRSYLSDADYVLAASAFAGLSYLVAQLVYYSIFSPMIWRWYLGTGVITAYVSVCVLVFLVIRSIHNDRLSFAFITLVASSLFAGSAYTDYSATTTALNEIKNKEQWGKVANRVVQWIHDNTEKDDILGTWSAGQIGYYSNRRVVNLEGLVGDVELLNANRENRLIEYVDSKNITYVLQWFPRAAMDGNTGYPIKDYRKRLWDLRLRLIYQNPERFKLIRTIPIAGRLSGNAVYIYQVVKPVGISRTNGVL